MKKNKGFTLIEMMLVVTLMALLMALSVSFFRHNTRQARVNKAALEMQQVMEAALAYYTDSEDAGRTDLWPQNNAPDQEGRCPVASSDFTKYYLPNQQQVTVFGGHYCWYQGALPPQPPAEQTTLAPPPESPLFAVVMQATSLQQAKLIAAQIPNAQVCDGPKLDATCDATNPPQAQHYFVRGEISPNGRQASAQSFDVPRVHVGYCIPGPTGIAQPGSDPQVSCIKNSGESYTVTATCGPKQQAAIIYTPDFLSLPKYPKRDTKGDPVLNLFLSGKPPENKLPVTAFDQPQINCDQQQVTPSGIIYSCPVSVYASVGSTTSYNRPTGLPVSNPVTDDPKDPLQVGAIGCSYMVVCQALPRGGPV